MATRYRESAEDAMRWLVGTALHTDVGLTWPESTAHPASAGCCLYFGTGGVLLGFINAYRHSADPQYLDVAQSASRYVVGEMVAETESGLYTGLAGSIWALAEFNDVAAGELVEVAGGLQSLADRARSTERGVEWNQYVDIVSGGAGIGLALLALANRGYASAVPLACRAGEHLIAKGIPAERGTMWRFLDERSDTMPNFSHGTAGIAYFLAALFATTQHEEYLAAALSGAEYLVSIADTDDNHFIVATTIPDTEKLRSYGWCHGPVGTARLFYALFVATGDEQWWTWVERAARTILTSGIPERRHPRFWDNVGQCCGSAGVAEFFLS